MSNEILDYAGGLVMGIELRERPDMSVVVCCGIDYEQNMDTGRSVARLEVIELYRTADPWQIVLKEAQKTLGNALFLLLGRVIIVDINEAGRIAIDYVTALDDDQTMTIPMVLTDEQEASIRDDGAHRIPRRDVVESVIDLFQNGRIRIASALDLAVSLEEAAADVSLRSAKLIEPLALALALCAWHAQREYGMEFSDGPERYDPMEWMDK